MLMSVQHSVSLQRPFQLEFLGLFELCDDILTWEFSFETKGSLQSIYWLLKRCEEGGFAYEKASVASLVHVIEVVSCKLLMIHMR